MSLPKPRWNDNSDALAAAERHDWIAVLPLGAYEQHGPHLPFETDRLIAGGIVERVIAAMPRTLPATFLPVEPVGYSVEHMHVPGTRTLAYDEAVERWLGIAEDLAGRGIRKFVMLNAHGGNSPLMTVVATEARIRFRMLAVATSWTRFGQPDGWIGAKDRTIDIHGGDIETSVMLALHPDKVDMMQARDFPSRQSEFARSFKHLRAYGPHAFGWRMSDLNPDGVAGNAAAATAERGEALLGHVAKSIIELLEDVNAFDIGELD
ncbi:creatininase family protein [Sinorhizobium medicae]|uniref:Creatininase n=2 Tax=Sinorhizobium medicae TaxID=110321 RepID=A0A508WX26_9HYPH|nr:creatininase family protein [Sinorhizobium medicae]MDX0423890.1 creatininase family protein [Sinorhizobium medicae]MDX0522322.1 creatininase family protein [Sinorhizobium medicae]MDX0546072.1 creatininase family protein [Sinorhizobium medicae]MDX0634138.1 creatininase family protein [Sinorhizobium medicae]MDX0713804.1 creatininase family protein [Sinorhizobium medicae]